MSSCWFDVYGKILFVSPAEVMHIRDALQILIPIPNSKSLLAFHPPVPYAQDTTSKRPSGNSPRQSTRGAVSTSEKLPVSVRWS